MTECDLGKTKRGDLAAAPPGILRTYFLGSSIEGLPSSPFASSHVFMPEASMATRPPCSLPEWSFQASFEYQIWLLYLLPLIVIVLSILWLWKAPAFTSFFSSDSLISGL